MSNSGAGWRALVHLDNEAKLRAMSKETGVRVEVLREAALKVRAAREARGLVVPTGPNRNNRLYPQARVDMPEAVRRAWEEFSELLHMKPSTALRTLAHEYLLYGPELKTRERRWVIGGRVVTGPIKWVARPAMTQAALDALVYRGRQIGFSRHEVMRALICEALAGVRKIRRPVELKGMFADPKRYGL